MAAGWHPWRALRDRTHVRFEFAELPADTLGMTFDRSGWRVIQVDYRLPRRERAAVLAHELVHDERGILYTDSTPAGLVQTEERIVDDETARRLVPLDDLDRWVCARVRSDLAVGWRDVADEWDVPQEVAGRALRLLEQRVRRRHPADRAGVCAMCGADSLNDA